MTAGDAENQAKCIPAVVHTVAREAWMERWLCARFVVPRAAVRLLSSARRHPTTDAADGAPLLRARRSP